MSRPAPLACGIISYCLLSHYALADSASVTQTINLSIPVVALLDVDDISPSFTFQAPQNAGDGLTVSASNNQFGVAISSNNSGAQLDVKIDQDLTPHGLKLSLSSDISSDCGGLLTLTTSSQYCQIGTRQTNSSTLMINAVAEQNMASYGNYTVEVTYTLTDN